jgi:hypothetical protein
MKLWLVLIFVVLLVFTVVWWTTRPTRPAYCDFQNPPLTALPGPCGDDSV